MTHRKEMAGFFCRWSLLALAGLSVPGVGATAVLATGAITSDLHAAATVPDMLWQADYAGRTYLYGYSSIPCRYGTVALLVHWPGRGRDFIIHIAEKRLWMEIRPPLQAGGHRLAVAGVPYGAFAFETRDVLFHVVRPGRDVFLFDARMAARALADGDDQFAACISELRRRGEVAFFHPGPLSGYFPASERLREFDASIPTVCRIGRGDGTITTIRHTTRTLNRVVQRKMTQPPLIITGDEQLAGSARRSGFAVDLVRPPGAVAEAGKGLRLHEDLAKLKEYLADLPIPTQ